MNNFTKRTLEIFEEINKVPRQSEHLEKIFPFLVEYGKAKGYEVLADEAKNILYKIPASPGYEKAPVLIIQGHMDMVCEKSAGSDHDFQNDPIEMYQDGDWLTAKETTLGADNGIALAQAFAVAEDSEIEHPALEILVTSDEETGMHGAHGLSPEWLKGRYLLNLDSEDEGIFTVGCAGGNDTIQTMPLEREENAPSGELYQLTVTGLFGGHSGNEIHTGRGNANRIMSRVLLDLAVKSHMRLVDFQTKAAPNAIPRHCEVQIYSDLTNMELYIKGWVDLFKNELGKQDPGLEIELVKAEKPVFAPLTEKSGLNLLRMLFAVPNGIEKYSFDINGLVETSSNMASVTMSAEKAVCISSQRSSVMSELKEMTDRVAAAGASAGADIHIRNKYPSWQPNMDSKLLKLCVDVYKETWNREPVVEAIHAGLECGLIGAKFPGMEMISMGPTIEYAHSPDERLNIPSLEKFNAYFVKLLKAFRNL